MFRGELCTCLSDVKYVIFKSIRVAASMVLAGFELANFGVFALIRLDIARQKSMLLLFLLLLLLLLLVATVEFRRGEKSVSRLNILQASRPIL